MHFQRFINRFSRKSIPLIKEQSLVSLRVKNKSVVGNFTRRSWSSINDGLNVNWNFRTCGTDTIMRVVVHHPVDFKFFIASSLCGQLHESWRSFGLQHRVIFDAVRGLRRTENWMGDDEERRRRFSSERDTAGRIHKADARFVCCCLFSVPLHLKILHKRLLIKYNKLFSFHFKFVAYLKFPDLCEGIRRVWVALQLIIDNEIHSRNSRHFSQTAILFVRITQPKW